MNAANCPRQKNTKLDTSERERLCTGNSASDYDLTILPHSLCTSQDPCKKMGCIKFSEISRYKCMIELRPEGYA